MTFPRELDALLSKDLEKAAANLPEALLYPALRDREEVQLLAQAIQEKRVGQEDVFAFVTQFMVFEKGQRFAHEVKLCALFIALDESRTPFGKGILFGMCEADFPEAAPLVRMAERLILLELNTLQGLTPSRLVLDES